MNRTVLRFLKKMTFLPQKVFLPFLYEYFTKKKLNLDNPQEFNEKIQWYKLNYQPKILNTLIDKSTVKDYVKNKIGEEFLINTIASYKNINDFDLKKLPNKFVIKAVHTNRQNIIVTDKNKLNIKNLKSKFKKWFRTNQYYRNGQEWGYKDIKPGLLIEEFIEEKGQNDLTDYKFFCFNGKPMFVEVHVDRTAGYKREIYDMKFERLPFNKGSAITKFEATVKKPSNFNEMIKVAKELSKEFPFVRVDLYAIEGKTFFGELTFYPADGRKDFYPDSYNKIIGDMFILPEIPKGKKKITEL